MGGGGGGGAFTWYITLYTILVQKWGVGAYMVMGAYKVLYSTVQARGFSVVQMKCHCAILSRHTSLNQSDQSTDHVLQIPVALLVSA